LLNFFFFFFFFELELSKLDIEQVETIPVPYASYTFPLSMILHF
jgi:hypothetical protein